MKLKPCPFCGASSTNEVWVERMTICSYAVRCDCGAQGPIVEDMRFESHELSGERMAGRKWNKRANEKAEKQ